MKSVIVAMAIWGWMALVALNLADIETQLKRCADALNESNHIMVGVENGNVPGAPRRFDQAPPAKEF